jgi:uncharacterized protein (DUF488 family)
VEICTIGTAQRSAESFFESLREAGVGCVVDTRLRATSQLAGFSKSRDLQYFVPRLLTSQYVVEPVLAPTDEMLDAYKNKQLEWSDYARRYCELLAERTAERATEWMRARFHVVALVCTESAPAQCHRRLAAEHLAEAWPGTTVRHL